MTTPTPQPDVPQRDSVHAKVMGFMRKLTHPESFPCKHCSGKGSCYCKFAPDPEWCCECGGGGREFVKFSIEDSEFEEVAAHIEDLHATIKRLEGQNKEAIDIMFAKMNELNTPKRGELHLLLISLLSR